jgi:hypothetical protein
MRAWIGVCAVLFASNASAEGFDDSEVPPLADGESAPMDVPNYFDARELGTGALAAYAACRDTLANGSPSLAEATISDYCGCFADAAIINVRAGHAAVPTEPQVAKCVEVVQGLSAPPLSKQLVTPTASIAETFQACLGAMPEGVSGNYSAFLCSCATDAWITDRASSRKLDDDFARCDAAARYRERTGQNPTRRQFSTIHVARSTARARSAAHPETAPPSAGMFIPYAGNGGGPTLCSDGMYSHSSGSGTCSHHGGVAGGRHRRR